MDTFGKASMFINEIGAYGLESLKYILCLRGVFKTYRTREQPRNTTASASALAAGGEAARSPLDEAGKQVLREMLDYVKPYLKA